MMQRLTIQDLIAILGCPLRFVLEPYVVFPSPNGAVETFGVNFSRMMADVRAILI